MKCPQCQNEVPDSANFCSICGKDVVIEQFFNNELKHSASPADSVNQNDAQPNPNAIPNFQQYPYPPYSPYPPTPTPETNGMAIAGFVCSFFFPILGWVFGGIGLSNANKRNGKGEKLSTAAIIISTVIFFIGLLSL